MYIHIYQGILHVQTYLQPVFNMWIGTNGNWNYINGTNEISKSVQTNECKFIKLEQLSDSKLFCMNTLIEKNINDNIRNLRIER